MLLAWLAIAFVLGVFLGPVMPVSVLLLGFVLGGSLIALWLIRHTSLLLPGLLAAAFIAGALRSPPLAAPNAHEVRYYRGYIVQIIGTVSQEPDVRDTGANYVISADQLVLHERVGTVHGQLAVHTSRATQLELGDRVRVTGRLLGVDGQVGPQTVLADHNLAGKMVYPRLRVLATGRHGVMRWLHDVRNTIENGIDSWLPEPEAALLIAITLGTRSAALGDLAPILVATGLIHLIAISGIKVALVAGTVFQLVRNLGRRWLSLGAPLATLWLYVLVTGFTPSGVRSAAMWTLVYLAAFLGRGTVALVSLSAVAAIMVGIDPGLLWTIGFQLSVIGTFAIVALTDPVQRLCWPIPSPFREAFAVSLVAQVGTLPVTIIGFHVISLSGPVANAAILPFLPLLIALGFALGTMAHVGWLAAPIAGFGYALLHMVILAATSIAGDVVPVSVPVLAPVVVVLYYAGFILLAILVLRRARWVPHLAWNTRVSEYTVSGVLGLTLLTAWTFGLPARPHGQLDWLATGQAMLAQDGDRCVLIDASPHPSVLLERLGHLLPFTEHRIDVVVVTDPQAANVGAFEAIRKHYSIGAVLDVGTEYPSATYSAWRAMVRHDRIPAYRLRTGVLLQSSRMNLRVLGPDGLYSNPLESTGMLRLSMSGTTVIIVGAATIREQHEAVFRGVPLKGDILVGGGPLDPDFVNAVKPRIIFTTVRMPGARILGAADVRIVG